MKKSMIMVAALAAIGTASAAIVPVPDMDGAGTYTLGVGDSWVADAGTVVADTAVAVVNVNGDWTSSSDYEVALGGVDYHASQDVTLNIGSAGSVSWGKAWIGDGPGGQGTIKIDIAEGGSFTISSDVAFARWHPLGWFSITSATMEDAWTEGILKKDGANAGTFSENFAVTNDLGTSFTMTAIPEPATLGLVAVWAGAVLFIRRRFMI